MSYDKAIVLRKDTIHHSSFFLVLEDGQSFNDIMGYFRGLGSQVGINETNKFLQAFTLGCLLLNPWSRFGGDLERFPVTN